MEGSIKYHDFRNIFPKYLFAGKDTIQFRAVVQRRQRNQAADSLDHLVVDQNGFRYRCSPGFSGCMAVTLEGERDDVRMKEIEMDFYENPILIFDKDGSVIYDASEPSLS